jgi:hypothetical protein
MTARVWKVGRFQILADFTGNPQIATRVGISSQNGQKDLTLAEATQLMASVGLTHSTPDPEGERIPQLG